MATGGGLDLNSGVAVARTVVNTDGSGNATWVFAVPFPVAPRVTFALGPSGDAALVEGRITALSATQVTVNVRRAPSINVLGIAVVSFPGPAPGVPVQFMAVAA